MKIATLIFVLLTTISCVSIPNTPNTYVLNYEDFGPPVIANELIGMDWWQWENHGDSRPKVYDIKVVVYKEITLNKVKENYPIDSANNKDYRYIEYVDAIKYLDEHIDENVFEIVTIKLLKTKNILVSSLGKK